MALKLVLASGNRGKLAELSDVLAELDAEVLPQSEFDVPDAVEDGLSFVENALIKARHAARHSGLPALADDSGLCVDALGGAPGIHSARYAGTHGDDDANNRKLIANLADTDNRRAHFHCALVFVRHDTDPAPIICEGLWWGEIVDQPRGDNGFGYDPLFYVPALGCCSAELPKAQKNAVSHRGQALAQLLARLRQR